MLSIYYSRASWANKDFYPAALWDTAAPTSACSDVSKAMGLGPGFWRVEPDGLTLACGPLDSAVYKSVLGGLTRLGPRVP